MEIVATWFDINWKYRNHSGPMRPCGLKLTAKEVQEKLVLWAEYETQVVQYVTLKKGDTNAAHNNSI